jgi:hypothetical protein
MTTPTVRLYDHPDGARIYFEPFTPALHCCDELGAASLPIGPLGLIALGNELIALGEQMWRDHAKD